MTPDLSALSSWHFPAGVLIGLASAAPIGPVNLVVIQRALAQNLWSALLVGFGGAIGDAVFASAAAFGIGAITTLLIDHQALIRLAGGAIMLVFAVLIWRASPRLQDEQSRLPAARMALVTFGMTITNPATLFFFIGSFGAAGFTGLGHRTAAALVHSGLVVAGVVSGSMLWWIVVSSAARRFKDRVQDRHLTVLNHGTAIVVALFGVGAIGAGVYST